MILEQVVQHRQPRLLLVRAGTGQVRVNGLPVPHFILLKEKDCLSLDEEFLLHITVYLQPMIGLASAECVGKECPVCRVPFAAASKCYFCPCGAAMHCEDSGTEESLQCAELCARSGCPACQRPVALTCGYSYMPEGIHE